MTLWLMMLSYTAAPWNNNSLFIYVHLDSDLTHSDMNSTGFVTEEGLSLPHKAPLRRSLTVCYAALLPPPFFSIHRRSRTISNTAPRVPLSPHALRTPGRRALGVLNTPPPKPTNVNQLKFKGSFTDPAHTRRRPSFGQVSDSFA